MSDHFTRLASFYSQYRTFDHEAINYITKKLASMQYCCCLGCGDGRYSLIEKLEIDYSTFVSMKCYDKFLAQF